MKEFFESIGTLLSAFILILLAAFFTAKFIANRAIKTGYSKYLKILDRLTIGNDKCICLIQLGEFYYLIGITNNSVVLIQKISQSEITPISNDSNIPFSSIIEKYLSKKV